MIVTQNSADTIILRHKINPLVKNITRLFNTGSGANLIKFSDFITLEKITLNENKIKITDNKI